MEIYLLVTIPQDYALTPPQPVQEEPSNKTTQKYVWQPVTITTVYLFQNGETILLVTVSLIAMVVPLVILNSTCSVLTPVPQHLPQLLAKTFYVSLTVPIQLGPILFIQTESAQLPVPIRQLTVMATI